jgi:small subunit ribosomal protein S1
VDRKSRAIVLSVKAIEAEEEAEAMQQYRGNDSATGTSLGDLLKEQITGQ